MTENNLQRITRILAAVKPYKSEEIEAGVIRYVCEKCNGSFCYTGEFRKYEKGAPGELLDLLEKMDFPVDIEFIIEFFEAMLEEENVNENGIVFTPGYIADYIVSLAMEGRDAYSEKIKLIDPGCGCGIFLIAAVKYFRNRFGKTTAEILERHIYGVDLDEDNIRRCRIVLHLYAVMNEGSNADLKLHLLCENSLKIRWTKAFKVRRFDYIVGNPPYVNIHDMDKETAVFLKETFATTKTGVYNIFYAFIEYGMEFLKKDGKLSYIVPNNFLTIKSAETLRRLMAEKGYVEKIIDFADNMAFKPVRTYNCIICLGKKQRKEFAFSVMGKTEDIAGALKTLEFETGKTRTLDKHGWNLVDRHTLENIRKIEGQDRPLKEFVRTGIATLRDEIYMVDLKEDHFYKNFNGESYHIEEKLVKTLYKIPELKQCENLGDVKRYLIFPYRRGKDGYEILEEERLKKEAPEIYRYLCARRAELDARDKGEKNPVAWYAYGRSQGLNRYGKKLVFPTFADKPRFTLVEDEDALFCNGYAVFENDYMELSLMRRILNSKVMEYYIKNTSYPIAGGYYCYQKKYIERFSLPLLSEGEKLAVDQMDEDAFNDYLINRYGLDL